MMVNKIIRNIIFVILLSITMGNPNVLWDFGIMIEADLNNKIINNSHNNMKLNSNEKKITINAIISDPFIPPVLKIMTNNINSYEINDHHESNLDKGLINQYIKIIHKNIFMKNYKNVIELINNLNLNKIDVKNRNELNYLLGYSLYKNGDYTAAEKQVLSVLSANKIDDHYILLSMIYESMNQPQKSKKYIIELQNNYPDSDYNISAQIKTRMLNNN